jgi:glucuronate isomerase
MSLALRLRLFNELDSLPLIDPHTHINALDPASTTLADILGYHYYTELAHSAGMPKADIEEPGLDPREKVRRLIANLGPVDNTIQYSWFLEMLNRLFDLPVEHVSEDNWEEIYDATAAKMAAPDWRFEVMKRSRLEKVFLTNDFDDPLEGFDTQDFVPCLRTDDLVFHLGRSDVRQRLARASGLEIDGATAVRDALARLFHHFTLNNARACAISLPPDFSPSPVSAGRAETAIASLLSRGVEASECDRRAASQFVFWTLAELCEQYRLPFDLMIGVNRGVYADGVHQGRDLYDSRVSLIQYKGLFNAFPSVTFPISVLASVTNQELASYAWIFPNVVTNGHWWYSNTPSFIEHDLAARLEAVPRTKQIGYYSDMYKLEFALPKFAMYKRILAKVLAQRFVEDRGWSETRAIELGKQVLRGNVETTFGYAGPTAGTLGVPLAAPTAASLDAVSLGAASLGAGPVANESGNTVGAIDEPLAFEESRGDGVASAVVGGLAGATVGGIVGAAVGAVAVEAASAAATAAEGAGEEVTAIAGDELNPFVDDEATEITTVDPPAPTQESGESATLVLADLEGESGSEPPAPEAVLDLDAIDPAPLELELPGDSVLGLDLDFDAAESDLSKPSDSIDTVDQLESGTGDETDDGLDFLK